MNYLEDSLNDEVEYHHIFNNLLIPPNVQINNQLDHLIVPRLRPLMPPIINNEEKNPEEPEDPENVNYHNYWENISRFLPYPPEELQIYRPYIPPVIAVNNDDIEKMREIDSRITFLLGRDEENPINFRSKCLYNLSKYCETNNINTSELTMRQIAVYCKSQMMEYQIEGIPDERCLNIIEHLFKIKPITKISALLVINCHVYMENQPLDPHLPSLTQLREFNINQREIMQYVETQGSDTSYHDRTKVYIGLPSIKPYEDTLTESLNDNCMMCCYQLEKGQDVYKIPCGHTFHRNNKDCQRDDISEIAHWFHKHVSCPLCKADIREFAMIVE